MSADHPMNSIKPGGEFLFYFKNDLELLHKADLLKTRQHLKLLPVNIYPNYKKFSKHIRAAQIPIEATLY